MILRKLTSLHSHHHDSVLEHFHDPKRSLGTICGQPLSLHPLRPRLTTDLLSVFVQSCLFQTFHMNEIIQNVTFTSPFFYFA